MNFFQKSLDFFTIIKYNMISSIINLILERFFMYTAISWYLHATREADESKFLIALEDWLLERNHNYGFKFSKNSLKYMISPTSARVIEGERATLQIAKGSDESNSYIAFSLDNEDRNILWIVECVFKKSLFKDDGCYYITLSKRINDPEHPGSHSRNISIPKFSEYLIQEGIATKEKGEEYIQVLSLDVCNVLHHELFQKLVNRPDNNYPIVNINKAYVKENGYKIISELRSLCHIRYFSDKSEKWAYKVIYPRLQYFAEYYTNDQWSEIQKNTNDADETRCVFFPKKQIQDTPYQIKQELITLVNEGISHLLYMDYNTAIDIINKHNTSTVFISQELANGLKEARKLRNLTQSELAELAKAESEKNDSTQSDNSEETSITGLLISRIETMRIQCIDPKKLLALEKCLCLPAYQLVGLASKEKTIVPNKSSSDTTAHPNGNTTPPVNNKSDNLDPKYCWHCGSKFPTIEGGWKIQFCPQCGKNVFGLK